VIANYNYGRFLADAINSVLSQDVGDKVELIICDAASTDNSVDVIKEFANGLPPNVPFETWNDKPMNFESSRTLITWWCSEKDGGQSAAFNKGFSHARGKYLTWLNADDVLVPRSLRQVIDALEKYPNCDWFTANSFRFLEDGTVMQANWGPHLYPSFLQRMTSPIVVFGPTSFFTRELYERVGKMDETLHYAMDNDLWVKFIMAGAKQRRINLMVWAFRMHEASKTAEFGEHKLDHESHRKLVEEGRVIAKRHCYRMSRFMHLAVRAWRFLDGSMLYRAYLRVTFKKFTF
jgi:glycosyltransferase involved in cell wall biosynthesis